MSSYLDYHQSIIEEGVLEAAKRIGLDSTIFDTEVMSRRWSLRVVKFMDEQFQRNFQHRF